MLYDLFWDLIRNQRRPSGSRGFPVLVSSHGLGGTRGISSSLLADIASHGTVVVALEHRDGSCILTTGADGLPLPYNKLAAVNTGGKAGAKNYVLGRRRQVEVCHSFLEICTRLRPSGFG
jgi:hypothetical protein